MPADIFAPCALGAVVNDETLERMKFKIIAGAANNQLAENRHGLELFERNILYAPDYVINAGGMINVFVELEGYDRERALRMSRGIFYNLRKIFQIARREGIPTNEAADHLVEERIAMMRHLKGMYTGTAHESVSMGKPLMQHGRPADHLDGAKSESSSGTIGVSTRAGV